MMVVAVVGLLDNMSTFTVEALDNDHGYWRLLRSLWAQGQGQTFAIVERDVLPSADRLAEMAGCSSSWCCSSYPYIGHLMAGLAGFFPPSQRPDIRTMVESLGCMKFGSELMVKVLNIFDGEPAHWAQIHARVVVQTLMVSRRLRPHVHWPPVRHLRLEVEPVT